VTPWSLPRYLAWKWAWEWEITWIVIAICHLRPDLRVIFDR